MNACAAVTPAGVKFKPNCTSGPMKYWEGPWYTYTTNDCGYRSTSPCGRRPPGELRVAVIGTSISNGMDVAYPDTFAARSEALLKARCRSRVDVQNASIGGASIGAAPQWHRVLDRLPEALALHPDAVVLTVAAMDLKYYSAPLAPSRAIKVGDPHKGKALPSLTDVKDAIVFSRSIMALRSTMFRDGPVYLDHFLRAGEDGGYLYGGLSPLWRMRLEIASQVLGPTIDEAKAAGTPIIVLYYPTYPQAVAAQHPGFAPDLQPLAFDDRIGQIVRAHGGVFVDMTPQVARQNDLTAIYYVSNDHPNGLGNKMIAERLVDVLAAQAPAFARCRGTA